LWTITGYAYDYKAISLDTSTDGQKIYLACRSQSAGINNIYITVSQNGGSSFGPQVAADDRPNNCDYPCLVADDYGWIYLSYEDRLTATNYDVRVQRSKTNGSTWEPSIKINDDLTNSQQLVPSIAVDEQLRVHCFWRDDRDVADTYFDLYYARGN